MNAVDNVFQMCVSPIVKWNGMISIMLAQDTLYQNRMKNIIEQIF